MQLQKPRVAPPQRLRLFPAAVNEHDAVEAFEDRLRIGDRLAVAAKKDDLASRRERLWAHRPEIAHAPGSARTGRRRAWRGAARRRRPRPSPAARAAPADAAGRARTDGYRSRP